MRILVVNTFTLPSSTLDVVTSPPIDLITFDSIGYINFFSCIVREEVTPGVAL